MKQQKAVKKASTKSVYELREQRFAYPSSHAAKRIAQRTSMHSLELMSLLDNDACVNIGQYAGSHRRHLLFYSPKDKFCYVAIQDERYGKIITILPPAFHKNLAWRITDDQYQLAKDRYEAYIKAVADQTDVLAKSLKKPKPTKKAATEYSTPKPYKIWVQALYISEDEKPKRKTLFRMWVDDYIDDLESGVAELLKDSSLYEKIDESIKLKGLFQGVIYGLCFRHEKDVGAFHTLTLRTQYEAETHARNYRVMRQNMNKLLSAHTSPYLGLPAPESAPLRLCWSPS